MTVNTTLQQATDWLSDAFAPKIIDRGKNIYRRGQIKPCLATRLDGTYGYLLTGF